MKRIIILLLIGTTISSWAATTINATNNFAYGANIGWLNARDDVTSGAVIGEYVCSGYIWAANVGWIALGSGSPTNGIYYQNLSANDFGVNQDGLGNLRGYAYGANIGWINFENTGAPKVDLKTGNLTGYVWSANCGWISLSNATGFVQTDHIQQGALAPNGLPIAWLLANFGTTNVNANADPTGKGMTIAQDYQAGTDPNNVNSRLVITTFGAAAGGTNTTVTWESVLTRCYYIQKSLTVSPTSWIDSGLGLISPDGVSTMRLITDTNAPMRFYRVQAVRPLLP